MSCVVVHLRLYFLHLNDFERTRWFLLCPDAIKRGRAFLCHMVVRTIIKDSTDLWHKSAAFAVISQWLHQYYKLPPQNKSNKKNVMKYFQLVLLECFCDRYQSTKVVHLKETINWMVIKHNDAYLRPCNFSRMRFCLSGCFSDSKLINHLSAHAESSLKVNSLNLHDRWMDVALK